MAFSDNDRDENDGEKVDDEEDDDDSSRPTISPELARALIQFGLTTGEEKRQFKNADAAKAVGELLRLFVLEARSRAAIEAECDQEADMADEEEDDDDDSDKKNQTVPIRADHFTKIAAELLMDFS